MLFEIRAVQSVVWTGSDKEGQLFRGRAKKKKVIEGRQDMIENKKIQACNSIHTLEAGIYLAITSRCE